MSTPDPTGELDGIDDREAEQLLADATTTDEASSEGDSVDPRLSKARREAASYRERLRAAEAQHEQLSGELDSYRRAAVERIAADAGMAVPADLHDVADATVLYDAETGAVNEDGVREAVTDVLAARPHWKAPIPVPGRPRERLVGTGDDAGNQSAPSWGDLLRRAR